MAKQDDDDQVDETPAQKPDGKPPKKPDDGKGGIQVGKPGPGSGESVFPTGSTRL